MQKEFVPKDFVIPLPLKTDNYRLEILTPRVGKIDYDAVMSSKERLRSVFGESTQWPKDDLTLVENINDLARHKKEFDDREAFAYTVLDLSGEKCIGCVYIEPSKKSKFDCEVYLWVRDSEIKLDAYIYTTVKNWVHTHWPFKQIAFPGREVSWDEWKEFK